MYDLTIIGGGPAGVAAGVYASRKQLRTLFLTESFGGQSVVSEDVQNWIGTVSISGDALAKALKEHLLHYAGDIMDVKEGERAQSIEKKDDVYSITTSSTAFQTKTILITTGSRRRKLEIPGAAEYENKGITYCASCDGPLFGGKEVVVIGGGNAGFETAAQLLAYCKKVTLLNRRNVFKADPVTIERVRANPKFKTITEATPVEVKGEKFVSAVVYEHTGTKARTELPTQGVFVEIGLIPSTEFISHLVKLDDYGRVIIDPWTQKTSAHGIWAAGDCTNVLYHQNNIAAGDAVRALEDIYLSLHAR